MDLYFAPLACSMATRIAFYEIGASATYIEVDTKAKKVCADGSDFLAINPMGQVPVLRTDDGTLMTENAAILQHVAERFPDTGIGAEGGLERSRLQQWLCFIGTELHKTLFIPLLDRNAPAEMKAYALTKAPQRLGVVDAHLRGRSYILDRFSVADAYLATVLNWSMATPMLDLAAWPAVTDYLTRMRQRPSIAKAMAEEMSLYRAELERQKAAA